MLLSSSFVVAQEPAAAPQAGDAAASKATVYVYRYKQFVGSALEPIVYCDEAELAHMDNGRYFAVKVDPGKHVFRSNDKQSGMELDLKAGQNYFIRLEIATGFMKGHGRLVSMSAEQASYELKSSKLKPLDAGKVVDKARVSVEEAHPEPTVAPVKAAVEAPKAVAAPASAAAPSAGPAASSEVMVTNSNTSLTPVSQTGDQVSLGEAARRAREKKQNPK
jgi:hypothetical protein